MAKKPNNKKENSNSKVGGDTSSNNKGNRSGYRPKKQGMQDDVLGTPYRGKYTRYNSTKQERRGEEAADIDAKMSRGNPVAYYKKFDQFVTDAATLPFAMPVGQVVDVTDQPGTTENTGMYSYTAPGVMAIEFAPAIGISENFNSAINRASIRFYTYLRSNQKASATYDHQDVTMMEVALDSCYMFHGLMAKAYSVVNLFTPANEYYSRALMKALNVDFDDLRANLQDFRAYINAFAYSLGQYALPAHLQLFDRHRWMVEGLYTDGETTKAQTYMFVPAYFYQYDNTVETGSQCTPKYWLEDYDSGSTRVIDAASRVPKTFAQIKAFGDDLLNAVSNEEDFAVISGDIYNFYGGDTYKLDYITENYSILPKYDKTVLSQIENATVVGNISNNSITQNPSVNQGAIVFNPSLDQRFGTNQCFMNFHMDRPTPDDVIEATRLMAVVHDTAADNPKILACGTEIVCAISVASYTNMAGSRSLQLTTISQNGLIITGPVPGSINVFQNLLTLAQFDWAPGMRLYWIGTGEGAKYQLCGWTWDIDNFDLVPENYISNIHLGCLLSLFSVDVNRD